MGYGAIAQFGIGSSSPVTTKLELVSGDIGLTEEFFESNGITGTRSHAAERVRQGSRRVTGSITLHPNSAEFDVLLPWILGGSASGDTFPLAESLTGYYVTVDRVDKVYTYSGVVVARAVFRGVQGGPLEVQLDLEGIDESVGNAGTFPSLTLSTASGPYMFADTASALTVGGTAYQFRSWEEIVDNVIDGERFFNSQTRASVPAKDRIVTLNLDGPLSGNYALYNLGVGGAAVVAIFTNSAQSITFSNVLVQFPRLSPQLAGKEEIMLPLQGQCRTSGSTKELIITNVA